ncbi:hypothetical protein ACIA5D_07145 [Actinoplanes sp. NPDC051513]|uniref:hypothetical protein n=1 Tax=Actinoplanes sp. NPDC051513 TaxID=3363908 RepID=UPI0037A4E992
MRIVKLAAGLAVGYVLGARAGREQYERIAASARRLSGSPTVEQTKQKAKDAATAKLDRAADRAGSTRRPRSSRSTAAGGTPAAAGTVTAGNPSPAAASGTPSGGPPA